MKLVVKQNDIADLFVQFLDEISSFKYDDEDEDEDEGFEEFMEEEFNGKEDFEEGADL